MIVACVSQEYADSQNCRMEFQFAYNSLKKPIVALLVGDREAEWRQTSIGFVVSELQSVVDFQSIKLTGSEAQKSVNFNAKINKTCELVKKLMNGESLSQVMQSAQIGQAIKKKVKRKAKKKQLGIAPQKKYYGAGGGDGAEGNDGMGVSRAFSPPVPPSAPPPPFEAKISAAPPPPPIPQAQTKQPSGLRPLTLKEKTKPPRLLSDINSAPVTFTATEDTVNLVFNPFNGEQKTIGMALTKSDFEKLRQTKTVAYLMEVVEREFEIKRANQRLTLEIADPAKPRAQWKKRHQWTNSQTLAEIKLTPDSIVNVMFKMSENMDESVVFAVQSSDSEDDQAAELEEEDYEEELTDEFGIRVPTIGDSVICKYDEQQWFAAVVEQIDHSTEQYTVKWVDGSNEHLHHR